MKRKHFLFTLFIIASLFLFGSCTLIALTLIQEIDKANKPEVIKKKYYKSEEAIEQLKYAYGGRYTFVREIKCSGGIKKHYVFTSTGGDLPNGSEVHFACVYNSAYEDIDDIDPIDTFSNGIALIYNEYESKYYNDLLKGEGSVSKIFTNAKIIFNNSERLSLDWKDWDKKEHIVWYKSDKSDFVPPDNGYCWRTFNDHTDAFIFIEQTAGETDTEEELMDNLKVFLGTLLKYNVCMKFEVFLLPSGKTINDVEVSSAKEDSFMNSCKAVYKTESSNNYKIETLKPFGGA